MQIAFIGLGVMGGPMAGHLLKKNYSVIGFNRSAKKALDFLKTYTDAAIATDITLPQNADISPDAFLYTSVDELIKVSDIIISCIGKDEDVNELGEKILKYGKPKLIWVDHTTTSRTIATSLYARLKQKDMGFIDAPVSGGEAGAQNGVLTAMCGGDDVIFNEVTSILGAYCKQTTLVGPSGSGQLTKMINQICLAGVVQGLSEGLHFAKQSGIDAKKVIDAISKGAAQSWQMDNRALTMIDNQFEFGFAIDLMRKDLGICFDEAKKIGASLPTTKQIDAYYQKIQLKGGGKLDTSALIKQFDD